MALEDFVPLVATKVYILEAKTSDFHGKVLKTPRICGYL